jgi:Uma2 family endonuclease
MSQPAQRPATYEDLLALPENVVGEIIHGELVVSPRPAGPHTLAASSLGGELGGPFQRGKGGPGGWWILFEPELHLAEHVLVPDLAGWRRERMPQVPETSAFRIAPDWVCEVVSPASARTDRGAKALIYARHGVRHLWLVDPIAKTLDVWRNDAGHWTVVGVYGASETVRAEPFEAIELSLGPLWGLND